MEHHTPGLTRLDGQRIIITGGASGMGATLVEHLPGLGAEVASIDLSPSGAARASAVGVPFFEADVASEESITGAVDAAVRELGGLDCLVHAAGIAPFGAPEEVTVASWERVMRINALGTILADQAVFRHLRDGGGRILNFASSAGISGIPFKAAYSMSKGAVVAWTRTAAQAWGQHGVTVNMIAPAIWTRMFEGTRQALNEEELAELDAGFARTIPIGGKLGDPVGDFLAPMSFYCSPGAKFITGQIVAIDGGLLMTR